MIARFSRRASAVFAFLAAGAAAAQQPPATAPTPAPAGARWIVDESGDTCVMGRQVAAEPDVTLAVRTYPGSGGYDLRFVRADWTPVAASAAEQLELRLTPTVAYSRARSAVLMSADGAQALRFGSLPSEFLAAFAQSSALTVRNGDAVVATYVLPQASAVAAVFADCEAGKLIDWGADPAGFEPGATRPRAIGSARDWYSGAVPEPTEGWFRVAARLTIGTDGQPTDCVILDASHDFFRTGACARLLELARYEPARDARRNPVRSVVIVASEWGLRRNQFTTTEMIRN